MKAILTEFHGWQGFACDRDLFDRRIVCGFVTVFVRRALISAEVRENRIALKAASDQKHSQATVLRSLADTLQRQN